MVSERAPRSRRTPRTDSVLVVDDDRGTRELLRCILERAPRLRFVGEAANGKQAAAKASRLQPDWVVLDYDMPGETGLDCIPWIRQASRATKIVLFSDDLVQLERLERAGFDADLFLNKGSDCSSLVPALLGMPAVAKRLRRPTPVTTSSAHALAGGRVEGGDGAGWSRLGLGSSGSARSLPAS